MFAATKSNLNSIENNTDYVVNDITEAEFGRKELFIAETEMPGLMALRKKYGSQKQNTCKNTVFANFEIIW